MAKIIPNDQSAFGVYAPDLVMRGLLSLTRACPLSWLGKRIAFLTRGIAVRLLGGHPLDVTALGARMRLYPYNNVCEKRILFTPQFFDPQERDVIARYLHAEAVMVDIGANIGGYSLFAAALMGPRARVIAIEPQPEIFERLVYNIRQNDFSSVKALNCAVADRDGEITLFVAAKNRGETSMRIVTDDVAGVQLRVEGRALMSLLEHEQVQRIDVMKLDVEGAEDLILEPFIQHAPDHVLPRLLLMEYSHARGESDLMRLLVSRGYREVMRTRTNVAYEHKA
jgi:FkbM family methyltransferase